METSPAYIRASSTPLRPRLCCFHVNPISSLSVLVKLCEGTKEKKELLFVVFGFKKIIQHSQAGHV